MPINQANKDKPVLCIACGKKIAEGYIQLGSIEIVCKCGVKNRIEAENKPEGRQSSLPGSHQTGSMVPMVHRAIGKIS